MKVQQRLARLRKVRRVVIKIGSGVLGGESGEGLCRDTLKRLVADICALEADGRYQVVLVSSGAVMSGRKALDFPSGMLSIPMKQAAAAVGQVNLMNLYGEYFSQNGRKVAQILLTHGDIEDRTRNLNVRNTITTLLDWKVIPIINENDSTAVDEIKFGDNDTLSAKIASVVETDLLLILSDVDGLFDSDPRKNPAARLIDEVGINDDLLAVAGDSSTGSGTGGMQAKVKAARIATDYGVPAWIIGGKTEGTIRAALREGRGGTFFHPAERGLTAKKHWILHMLKPKGTISVDAGAVTAIKAGKSLLPSGIIGVKGKFEAGEAVAIADGGSTDVARGLVNYGSAEIALIKGKKSSEIEPALGFKSYDEVIHRDNMAVLERITAVHGDMRDTRGE